MKNSKLFRLSFKIIIVILFMICIFPQKETNVLKAETNITYYDSMSEIKLGHLFAEYISKYF